MKPLDAEAFVDKAQQTLGVYKTRIPMAETFEKAKESYELAMGYIDCLCGFNSVFWCPENDELVTQLDKMLELYELDITAMLVTQGCKTGQDKAEIGSYVKNVARLYRHVMPKEMGEDEDDE